MVDDERSVRELTSRLLLRLGHEELVADSPGEARRLVASHPRPIDLFLTDVVMPGVSGRQLAERVRQLEPNLPILYVSGDPAGIIDPDEALPPRSSFLAKPFRADTLSIAVQEALSWETA